MEEYAEYYTLDREYRRLDGTDISVIWVGYDVERNDCDLPECE